MARRSTGSWSLPSISRVRTCGWPTVSSKPSRRMISTRIASCSSPRPWTSQASGRSVSWTRRETLPTSSWSSRFLTWRAVSLEPSRPASGDVLIPMVIDSDGSSTVMTGSGRGSSGSASVSPIVTSGMPATAMISPGPGLVGLDPVERLGDVELGDRGALDRCRRPGTRRSAGPCLIVRCGRGTARGGRRRGEASRLVTCACSGCPSGSYVGRRGCGSSSRSISGSRSAAGRAVHRSRLAWPALALQ